jgi:hypothetical protein
LLGPETNEKPTMLGGGGCTEPTYSIGLQTWLDSKMLFTKSKKAAGIIHS